MYSIRLCCVTAALGLALASCALADTGSPTGIIVSDTAQVKAQPDLAYVTFGVVTEAKNAGAAASANAEIAGKLMSALAGFGIPKSDVETFGYSVEPNYNYEKGSATIIGYRVSNTVRVKTKVLSKIGGLLDVGTQAGANTITGVTFTVEDDSPYRRQALALAVKKAQAKAQTMADALGVKLGKIVTAEESSPGPRPMETFGPARPMAVTTPINPGQVEASASVTLTFAIL